MRLLSQTDFGLAEEIMNRLTSNEPRQRTSVDWLTEAVRRLSEAAMEGNMQSVKITLMRLEKVGQEVDSH